MPPLPGSGTFGWVHEGRAIHESWSSWRVGWETVARPPSGIVTFCPSPGNRDRRAFFVIMAAFGRNAV
jgi:hypothetical protein